MARDLADLAHELGSQFAVRAARHDDDDLFVTENYDTLKAHGILRAGIPVELGGGGAEHRQLAEMLRILARYCSSTALALAMHTHQVATMVWRWRRDPAPVDALLRSVAAQDLVLVSSGPSVLHFPLSLRAAGVTVLDTWRVLGMRGTGSHDIAIDGAFVPDSAIFMRR